MAHVWWLLFYIYSGDLHSVGYLVLAMVDCVLLFITFAGTLLAMLQDRRRSVWSALVLVIPFVALGGTFMVYSSSLLELITAAYIILLYVLFTGYMVVAIRQYGRWLNDNYADLENKKVWLSQAVALVCMLLFVLYVLATDMVFIWFIHIIELVLVGLLLWRVETLPELENSSMESAFFASAPETVQDNIYLTRKRQPLTIPTNIEQLLDEFCVGTQLYLQHDLSLLQLAQAVGINRFYLSQYFSRQGTTYNAYINDLRINHFMSLYREAAAAQQSITAQQLASDSGYRSYSTFSLAFKQRTGQSVKAWMRETTE
ncbi:MAG: helix-turn-helix transcriptional regulator [Bacteroidaceae bacterium]|nr:helix-turn-helix transcriptional regulator [Bacteroidaceae bacterium]